MWSLSGHYWPRSSDDYRTRWWWAIVRSGAVSGLWHYRRWFIAWLGSLTRFSEGEQTKDSTKDASLDGQDPCQLVAQETKRTQEIEVDWSEANDGWLGLKYAWRVI